jgi:hypothetical protein
MEEDTQTSDLGTTTTDMVQIEYPAYLSNLAPLKFPDKQLLVGNYRFTKASYLLFQLYNLIRFSFAFLVLY